MGQYNSLLKLAIKASFAAGKEILEVYNKETTEVEIKGDNSPLTQADKRAHGMIANHLIGSGYHILSEEGKSIPFQERKNWDTFWMVDPLDGTKEFIKRNGEFTVNIALIRNNKPVLGVVYVPVTDTLYFAAQDFGSYKLENGMTVLRNEAFINDEFDEMVLHASKLNGVIHAEKYTVVASRSHMSSETEEFINECREQHGEVALISKGSSLKMCLIAEGMAHVYPRLAPTMEWDTAAGQAVVVYSGKSVTNFKTGKEMEYNKESLLNEWFVCKK